jgi:hypothetical protein
MPLNLKSTGGGGIILNPNATPTDVTLNLPATAGTLVATTGITVTGARGGNAALASLLTALATSGLITDGTTT